MTAKTVADLQGEQYIDTRDIIEAAQALRDDIGLPVAGEEDELTDEERALLDFDDGMSTEIEDYPYGASMIRQDCFEDYARELAEDIGAISGNEQWPCTCIDWERAARELAMDYTSVEFLGHDYYVR